MGHSIRNRGILVYPFDSEPPNYYKRSECIDPSVTGRYKGYSGEGKGNKKMNISSSKIIISIDCKYVVSVFF